MYFLFIAYFVLYLLSSEELDLLDDESDKLGYDSGSSGMHYFCDFYFLFMSILLVFWGLIFSHQQESSIKVFNYLHSFGAQVPDFPSKFKNQFSWYSLTLRSQRLQML